VCAYAYIKKQEMGNGETKVTQVTQEEKCHKRCPYARLKKDPSYYNKALKRSRIMKRPLLVKFIPGIEGYDVDRIINWYLLHLLIKERIDHMGGGWRIVLSGNVFFLFRNELKFLQKTRTFIIGDIVYKIPNYFWGNYAYRVGICGVHYSHEVYHTKLLR
jgi:hypothetical protein